MDIESVLGSDACSRRRFNLSVLVEKKEGDMEDATRLTARETDVLRLMARGHPSVQIGDQLGVPLHTVARQAQNS